MDLQRKIAVYLFTALITYIGISFPLVAPAVPQDNYPEGIQVISFEQAPLFPVLLIQEKSPTVIATGWKTQIRLPGLELFCNTEHKPKQDLTHVRKIFVVDLFSWQPCKSILLYPFHEFS